MNHEKANVDHLQRINIIDLCFIAFWSNVQIMFEIQKPTAIQELKSELLQQKQIRLFVKREDEIDSVISGNKFRKLKYNFIKAKESGITKILSFGGAYSNHIHALAYAGNRYGLKTIGIIRGERIEPLNPTLKDAEDFGMQMVFVNRETYRSKNMDSFLNDLRKQYGDIYIVPEGGSNVLAVQGCTEIIEELNEEFDYICCSCGTGGTLAGIICGLAGVKNVLGFPALKGGEFLKKDIGRLIFEYSDKEFNNWELIPNYHFRGYAKFDWDLISFINDFKSEFGIPLDPVYTGKMMFGVFDLLRRDFFSKGTKILAIHTGGLQGIRGFNERFGNLIK